MLNLEHTLLFPKEPVVPPSLSMCCCEMCLPGLVRCGPRLALRAKRMQQAQRSITAQMSGVGCAGFHGRNLQQSHRWLEEEAAVCRQLP